MSSTISNLSASTQTKCSNLLNVSTQTISLKSTPKQNSISTQTATNSKLPTVEAKETSKIKDPSKSLIATNESDKKVNSPKLKKTFTKSICKFCFIDHTAWKLSWPLRQYCFTKFIPTSDNQLEWPAKQVVDKYVHDFDDHKCKDCVQVSSYWHNRICDELGVSIKYGESRVLVCKNNLVNFGQLPWWEKMGIP